MYGKLVVFVVVVGLFDTAFGCNGYKANLIRFENCAGPDAVITADSDFTVKLNKKCELVPTGCVTNKAFTTAQAKFTLKKDKIVMKEGDLDLCQAADEANNEAKNFMKVFSMPDKCPVVEVMERIEEYKHSLSYDYTNSGPLETICANNHKLDLSKYKNMMSMAKGNFELNAVITHDTGKSCIIVELEISK